MKIAVVTDDSQTISQHFGRARKYAILTVKNGQVIERQVKDRVHHDHAGHADDPLHAGGHHNHDHAAMLDPIADCQVLLARGMGTGAHQAIQARGIQPIITDIANIDQAVAAFLSGALVDHPEKLH